MAGSESAKIADAYILVHARKAREFEEEARRAGKDAGEEYQKSFDREASKTSPAAKAARQRQGKEMGAELGDAAGKEAGSRTSAGITESLGRSRAARRRDGETIGRPIGAAAGVAAGRATAGGVSDALRASRAQFRRDGASIGDQIGQAAGAHAAVLTRKAIRIELAAQARAEAAAQRIAERAARSEAAGAKALEREQSRVAAAAVRELARTARAEQAAAKLREREAAKAAAAAEKTRASFRKSVNGIYSDINRGASRLLVGGQGIFGKVFSVAGLGALSASASGLGSVLAGTVGAVAQLSGAIALLPAVGAAGAVSMAALKVGVHDVSDALSDNGDPKKYAEDLKKLAPAAQSFVKAVVKLKPELKDLRNEVQQGLFKGLDKQVTNLGSRYIPILSKGLTGVSKSFNAAGQDVGEFLDKASTGKQVSGIFTDIGKAAGKLAYAAKPAVAAVLDLVGVGTGELPKFADKVTDLSKRFRLFVGQAKNSGDLKDFIDGGIRGFKDLGRVVGGAGRILGGIFKAGGGANGSALGTFADLLNKVGDQIARPEFQKGLGHFFDSFKEAGGKVGDALPRVADALVALEPAISKLVSGSGTAFASLLTSMANAAIALAPTLNVLAAALASLAPHAGALAVTLISLKGALLALRVASDTVDAVGGVGERLDKVGLSAVTARARVLGFSGALGVLGTAVAVVGIAALARQMGDLAGKAQVATVDTGKLAASLDQMGKGGQLGGEGLKLFTNKGGFGLIKDGADTSKEALDRFGTAAFNALDKGWDARLGRWQSFGSAESAFRKQTEQLDKSFAGLASRGSIDSATNSFEQFIAAGVKAGVPVASLKTQFPQFSAALRRAGLTVDNTTGKVRALGGAITNLPRARTIHLQGYGFIEAISSAKLLASRLRAIPRSVTSLVKTEYLDVFASEVAHDNARARNHRKAFGGFIDPRLGGPRQDNVPLLVSGGEYVMNAFATSQPGVLALLEKINASNRLPQKLATGGQVARTASVGLGDLSNSQPARIERIVAARQQDAAPVASSRLHPDDIAALGAVFERAMRQQRIVLDSGAIAGSVYNQGGRF